MSSQSIATAVLPLLVALFNLLAGGYALAASREDRTRLGFALGPLGVGLWGVAWFTSLFNPTGLVTFQALGSFAGLLSVSGFTADALREMRATRARRLAVLGLALAVGAILGLGLVMPRRDVLSVSSMVLRVSCVALLGVLFVSHLLDWKHPEPDRRRFARRATMALTACGTVYFGIALAALLSDRTGVDPLLLTVLVAETMTLLYILHRKVEVHILLSRAVTYVILSLAVALIAALVFRSLGYEVDIVLLTTTVLIALFAAILFMGLGELMSAGIERALFPERTRLTRALTLARGEAAALRRRLERAEKLAIAGELAASVAHEIKNPLSPIRGYAQLLAAKLDLVDPSERAFFDKGLSIIRSESDRIDARVQELLRASRPDKVMASSDERFDLDRVLAEAIALVEAEPGVREVVDLGESSIGSVQGNEDEIRGALVNLLKNAAEAMLELGGGRIEVSQRQEASAALVEIRDEGTGLIPEAEAHAFEAFYTTKAGGTGLGMAIARSAIEAAGGSLSLESRADRRGAVARVRLPLAAEPGLDSELAPAGPVREAEGARE